MPLAGHHAQSAGGSAIGQRNFAYSRHKVATFFATMPSVREGAQFAGAISHILVVKWRLLLASMSSLLGRAPFVNARW